MAEDTQSKALLRHLRDQLGIFTPEELANIFEVTVETLAEWRSRKTGPDYVKLGKRVMYRISDIYVWMQNNTITLPRV